MRLKGHLAKDLRLMLRDRRGLVIGLVLPAVILGAYRVLDLGAAYAAGHNAPAFILILAVAFPIITVGATSLVHERRAGTTERVRRTPSMVFPFILSKSLTVTVLLVAQIVIIILIARWTMPSAVNRVAVDVAVILLLVGMATHAMGLMVSAISRTEIQAMQLASLLSLVMLTLSGFMRPLDEIGMWGRVAGFLPVAQGYSGLDALILGHPDLVHVGWLVASYLVLITLASVISLRR